jgi:uncharacterized protein YggE
MNGFPSAGAGGLSVVGQAVVSVSPDLAVLTLGIQKFGKDAVSTLKATGDSVLGPSGLIRALTSSFGLQPGQIRPGELMIQPQAAPVAGMSNPSQPGTVPSAYPAIVGYVATSTITLVLPIPAWLDRLGQVLDVAAAAGATLGAVTFRLKDEAALRRAAVTEAVRDAHDKAAALADAMGTHIGEILAVAEEAGLPNAPSVVNPGMYASAGSSPAGEVSAAARVWVTYALER